LLPNNRFQPTPKKRRGWSDGMDSPYHATVLDVDSVKDCGSTYGLFLGIALALMKMRLGAGLVR